MRRPTRTSPQSLTALWLGLALTISCAPGVDSVDPAGSPEAAGPETAEPAVEDVLGFLDPSAVNLLDLTYPLSPDSLYWPTGAPFTHEYSGGISEGGYWYASGSFSSPEHLGTHLDAPIHFGEEGWTSAAIPVRRLIAPAIVIDISAAAAADADAVVTPADIEDWESRNGRVPMSSVVIVRTGWASKWPDWNAYYGSETPQDVSTLHFPGVSAEAAGVLVDRGVVGVGIDTASIDPGNSSTFEAHQVLAAANIYNLENLTGVDNLPELGFGVIALPMKIEGGTGGPTRVVAVLPADSR